MLVPYSCAHGALYVGCIVVILILSFLKGGGPVCDRDRFRGRETSVIQGQGHSAYFYILFLGVHHFVPSVVRVPVLGGGGSRVRYLSFHEVAVR